MTTHMQKVVGLLDNWGGDLADLEIILADCLNKIAEVRGEVNSATMIGRQYMLLAATDTEFLGELFKKLDRPTIIMSLRDTDEKTRKKFISAINHLTLK